MMHTRTELGGVRGVVVQGGTSLAPPALGVVLCHGFGAPGDDLVGLAPELLHRFAALDGPVRFFFPEGPLSLAELGYGNARAWWHIDLEARVRLQSQGEAGLAALREEIPLGLAPARKALLGAVDAFATQSALPVGRVVLGGFSQGAMLATDVALRLEEPPAALCIFSGTLLAEKDWRLRAARRTGLPVLQSHGRQDPLLAYSQAQALCALFTQSGLTVDFLPFDGGHTIPAEALDRLGALLGKLLKPS